LIEKRKRQREVGEAKMSQFDGVRQIGNPSPTNDAGARYTERATDSRSESPSDDANVTVLVSQYAGFVYWLCRYLTEDTSDAEEVLQKSFLALQCGFTRSQQNESIPMRLARVAVHESIAKMGEHNPSKLLRLNLETKTDAGFAPQEVVDWSTEHSARYSRYEMNAMIHAGLHSLATFPKVVFLLHDIGHLSAQEIANLFYVSVSRVKSHLLRGRLEMREHFNQYFKSNLEKKAAL
jgi:DNA-directed RNA polymerase specialized sigma24 family protein